jgi:hypothetical protein
VSDKVTDEQMLQEFAEFFDLYMIAHQPCFGDPSSYSDLCEYEQVMDYYVENTNYIATEISKKEFLTFEKSHRACAMALFLSAGELYY